MGARKIIICFDGTGNEVGDRESNILRLYKGLTKTDNQIVHYLPGIGTLEGPRMIDWAIPRAIRSVSGLAFGMGLENDVLDAYAFLCRTYRGSRELAVERRALRTLAKDLNLPKPPAPQTPAQVDQIYIFGFSRGAYAARILAGFINNFGLIRPDRLHVIVDAFRAYRAVTQADRDQDPDITFKRLRQYDEAFDPKPAPIRALGLFDTVASMVRLHKPLSSLRRYGSIMELGTHASVVTNPSVRIVLQALALDERRTMFRALPWKGTDYYGNRFKTGPLRRQIVRQRWFPGYHSDVGGTNGDGRGIGQLTLTWLLRALEQAEIDADLADEINDDQRSKPLRLNHKFRNTQLLPANAPVGWTPDSAWEDPNAVAPIHDSMSPAWLPLEYIPKTRLRREFPKPETGPRWYLPLSEPRLIGDDHEVDDSIAARMRLFPTYRPENAPQS